MNGDSDLRLAVYLAGKGFLARVCPYVRCEVVGAGEEPHADAALERFLARVGPHVPGKLITPTEPPHAPIYRAVVGLLPRSNGGRRAGCLFPLLLGPGRGGRADTSFLLLLHLSLCDQLLQPVLLLGVPRSTPVAQHLKKQEI